MVFLLPPFSVPALGGDRWYTQNSTNPAGTKLTCFWRIPTQQLFAPGGCSTFDPILAGARSDFQCWVLRAVCPELALIMSWAFLLFFLSSFSLLSLVQMYNLLKTMSNELPPLMMLTYGFIGDVCIFWGQRRGLSDSLESDDWYLHLSQNRRWLLHWFVSRQIGRMHNKTVLQDCLTIQIIYEYNNDKFKLRTTLEFEFLTSVCCFFYDEEKQVYS